MNTLRRRIEEELNSLDSQAMVALYEYLRQMKRVREHREEPRVRAPSIQEILELTSTSASEWAETICEERDERV